MTSRVDVLKTNEFLRRRKLRLQQVREQSKDIAKKIRQRAKVENLRHLDSIDAKKEKEYFDCQEKLVQHLEFLYSKGLQSVGAGHNDALGVTADQDCVKKKDISKLRGKEAAETLRKKKQEKLDTQKKLLDRKLQARETANDLSREKSAAIAKCLTKQKAKEIEDTTSKLIIPTSDTNQNQDSKKDNINQTKNDMGTQWETVELPNEWVPNVPVLSFPKDESLKESHFQNSDKTDKSKRLNLFALSDEMPSSLRGGLSGLIEDPVPIKPSLTHVSEYLQNRNLRLRHTEPSSSKKADDLHSIKQTILRTRATRTDGNVFDNICHVLDKQVIPVPSWEAEEFGAHFYRCNYHVHGLSKSVTRAPVYKLPSGPISLRRNLQSRRALKDRNLQRQKTLYGNCTQSGNKDKSSLSTEPNIDLSRKKSVTVYNHNTRNVQDILYGDERLVSRDNKTEDDAYAQALKETTIANSIEKEQLNKHQKDMRTKVAINKNNVDKEYKDTLAFLNTLARDKCEKPIKTAFMDEHHQQLQNERHQRKLQEEFNKIEKESKHNCKHSNRKSTISENKKYKSRSTVQREMRQDFEYSWMPVPESDGSLAVHTIPNTNRKSKSGNTVKFSQADSYHEYRSRHKHTPPTKDVSNNGQKKRVVETVILQETSDSDANESSATSKTSSVENLNLEKDKTEDDSRLKDAERIIIYKILETKKAKKSKEHKKDKSIVYANSATIVTDEVNKKGVVEGEVDQKQKTRNTDKSAGDIQRGVSFDQLQEGVYEAVSSNGDNIASMYFTEGSHNNDKRKQCQNINNSGLSCCCSRNKDCKTGGNNATRLFQQTSSCRCRNKDISNLVQPSAATSTTSFTTAFNEKSNNRPTDSGFVKLIEEGGQDGNKFYVGTSGFLKDDNYEVIIQLRKKETETVSNINKNMVQPHTEPVNISDVHVQEMEENILDNAPNERGNEHKTSPIKVATSAVANDTVQNLQHGDEQFLKKGHIEVHDESNLDSQFKKMCEKSVHTSFHDEIFITPNVPKTDSISKPGTSTYTQTSFNSSMPRPAFMHMSSSTSTAYMSPPELILPNFLKQNYVLTKEELYESENTMNQLGSNFDVIETEHSNEFIDCRCSVCERYPTLTPPNTARSRSKSSAGDAAEKKRKYKCHKCRSRSDSNICHKTHKKKSSALKTKSTRDLPSEYAYPMLKQSAKNKIANTRPNCKASNKINPIVKDYVNKLLDLNSEGLKVIEIINQDCSAVTTPGSSIINLPCNRNKDKLTLENKISLEQLKNVLKQQIIKENTSPSAAIKSNRNNETEKKTKVSLPTVTQVKLPKKKSLHKVKSLNISKHILKKKKPSDLNISTRRLRKTAASVSSSANEENKLSHTGKYRVFRNRSKSSTTTQRKYTHSQYKNSTSSDIVETSNSKPSCSSGRSTKGIINNKPLKNTMYVKSMQKKNFNLPSSIATKTHISSDSGTNGSIFRHLLPPQPPVHISTQTNGIIDAEIHFMKIAEDKLQNMEKIADLTERCTKRLSNLAKVLEEVRRNKSLVYSQISTSDSTAESDPKANKGEPSPEISVSDPNILTQSKEIIQKNSPLIVREKLDNQNVHAKNFAEFTAFLKDIPKPDIFSASACPDVMDIITDKSTITHIESENTKSRGKPPPALSRIHLKRGQDVSIIPHELSTVIEVDSPMSMRLKSRAPSRQDTKLEGLEKSDHVLDENNKGSATAKEVSNKQIAESDFLKSNNNLSRRLSSKQSSTDSSDDSKMRMMDMKKFNDIMLKPFISLKEYAKQCTFGLNEGSNLENVIRDDQIHDDLSSLHSDGSLPDVIAELLKRNIISEPFKFDTGSNVNSTTVSSESTLSVLALSKARKEKKKGPVFVKNKENIAETSETLSISSNPDLENAFQKLGMGWASSTLKKTKERLALSSSSNTSSSSMTQFKIKSFNQDVPNNLVTDSTSSLLEVSAKSDSNKIKISSARRYNIEEVTRNAVQQTSLTNSMTVKEFLTNELAKKITFNNKSSRKGEEEFVSLYETKMPEEMKLTNVEDEQLSVNTSGNNNRARTSTPVQIFKSQKYQSSSTSNTSNGFFSNADDLSSVKVTSSIRNHSTSDKDDLTIPNYSLKTKKGQSDCSKSD